MVTVRHHVDGVVADGEVFIFALGIVIMTDTEAVAWVNFEEVHLFVAGLARQIIYLMLVGWIGTPVAAGGEGLTNN